MALKRLGIVDLVAAIQKRIESTGKRAYDHVPMNAESPFYFVEVVQQRPANSKTMYREIYTVWVHCIAKAEDNGSSVGINNLIQDLQEAMTEDINLPEHYILVMQTDAGLQSKQTDETGEHHAVCVFEFMVSYGFMTK